MPPPTKPEEQPGAGGVAAATLLPLAGGGAAAAGGYATAGALLEAIVGALRAALEALRARIRSETTNALSSRYSPDDVATAVTEELLIAEEADRRALERVRAGLRVALDLPTREMEIARLERDLERERAASTPDPRRLSQLARDLERLREGDGPRERALRGLLRAEERYAAQRARASLARAAAASERAQVRRESPEGAFWLSNPNVIEHTAGCIIMSGGGRGAARFWPWVVLDRVHPPRHHGCPCRLVALGAGRGMGLRPVFMSPGDAIRAAENVLQEGEAEGLLTLLELAHGGDEAAGQLLDGFAVPWREHLHPRDRKGRFRHKLGTVRVPSAAPSSAPAARTADEEEFALVLDGIRRAVEAEPTRIQHGETGTNGFWVVLGERQKIRRYNDPPTGPDAEAAVSVHSHGSARDDAFSSGDFYAWLWHVKRGRAAPIMAVLYADGTADTAMLTDETDPKVMRWGEKRWFDNLRGDRESVRAFTKEHGIDFREGLRWASTEDAARLDVARGGRYGPGGAEGLPTPTDGREVIGRYTGAGGQGVGARAVNARLYGARQSGEENEYADWLVPQLDEVFAAQPLKEPTTLYRGRDFYYGLDARPEHAVGEEIKLPGFVSTSTDRKVAREFAADAPQRRRGGVIYKINAPAGARAVAVESADRKVGRFHNEREVILERGGTFKVRQVGRPDKDNVVAVTVDFVPPQRTEAGPAEGLPEPSTTYDLSAASPSALANQLTLVEPGQVMRLSDGTRIKRDADGTYRVLRKGNMRKGFDPDGAAERALNWSARSRDPDSVGGATAYRSFAEYLEKQGGGELQPGDVRYWGGLRVKVIGRHPDGKLVVEYLEGATAGQRLRTDADRLTEDPPALRPDTERYYKGERVRVLRAWPDGHVQFIHLEGERMNYVSSAHISELAESGPPKVGDYRYLEGQRVKVVKILPDGHVQVAVPLENGNTTVRRVRPADLAKTRDITPELEARSPEHAAAMKAVAAVKSERAGERGLVSSATAAAAEQALIALGRAIAKERAEDQEANPVAPGDPGDWLVGDGYVPYPHVRRALAKYRPFGGDTGAQPDRSASGAAKPGATAVAGAVQAQAALVPSAWLERVRENVLLTRRKSGGRAFHSGGYMVEGGVMRKGSMITANEQDEITVLHELMHAAEESNPYLAEIMGAFWERRRKGEAVTKLKNIDWHHRNFKNYEVGVADEYPDVYFGKSYREERGSTDPHWELLTMGAERTFYGRHKMRNWRSAEERDAQVAADAELDAFILGLLAAG